MSISSMANLAYARRSDVAPMDVGLQNLSEVGAAKAPKPETVSTATSALEAIVAYIPTEVVTAGKDLPKGWAAWPKWEMAAGTVAFAVWAAALPASPLGQFDWFTAAFAGILALVVSFLLGLFAPLFSRAALATE